MDFNDIKAHPPLLKDVKNIRDYWDIIGNADIITQILADPALAALLTKEMTAELEHMSALVSEHPELRKIIQDFGVKAYYTGGFTLAEIGFVVTMVINHYDSHLTVTPLNWASFFSGLLLSLVGQISTIRSRRYDYSYYKRLLKSYTDSQSGEI